MEETKFPEESLRAVIDILAGITTKGDGTQMKGVQAGNPFGDQAAIDAAFVPFDDEGDDTTIEDEAPTQYAGGQDNTMNAYWTDRNTELVEESTEKTEEKAIPDGFEKVPDFDVISDDDLDSLLEE